MIQATLERFRDHGFADLGRAVDPRACAELLAEARRRRRFGPEMFLSEAAFLANPRLRGVDQRPNLLEDLQDRLAFIEEHAALDRLLAALLGDGFAILDRKLVCGVPRHWIPDWLARRFTGHPADDLGACVHPDYRDLTYFHDVDYHQDIIEWTGRPADFVTLYVYLHRVGPADAPLHVLPGSHRLGATRFPHRLDRPANVGSCWRYGGDDGDAIECRRQVLVGGAGYAVLWHPFTLHGTQPHRGETERISLRYRIAKDEAAAGAYLDTVNRRVAGAPSLTESRADVEDDAPIMPRNAIDAAPDARGSVA